MVTSAKKTGFIAVLLTLIFIVCVAGTAVAYKWATFNFDEKGAAKSVKLKLPKITLTAEEENNLYAGKPVTRLIDMPGGLKAGYLRFFTDYDPVTTFMVVTDADHFDLQDPAFPKTGSVFDKRNTFMPYTFEVATCQDEGRERMFQLLVMPFVDPRKLCIDRYHNTDGFPFESYWTQVDHMCCVDKIAPDIKEKYFDKAVTLEKNIGTWHISPLPKKFRKSEKDIMRSDCIYYVDTNPGGDLSKLTGIVNKAQSVALPTLVDNVNFHCKRWEAYLAKHHSSAMVTKYKGWVEAYKQSMQGK